MWPKGLGIITVSRSRHALHHFHSGQYVAYAKCDGQWRSFDDALVTATVEAAAVEAASDSHVFVYRRVSGLSESADQSTGGVASFPPPEPIGSVDDRSLKRRANKRLRIIYHCDSC